MAIERTARSPLHGEFERRIKDRRNRLGISQEAVAERSGIARAYVGQVETGMRKIGLNNIARLAVALELDLAKLMKGLQDFEGQP